MTELLELRDVSVAYGSRLALRSVSVSIAHGAQVAVVGPNGAGKSTLFKAMMGLLPLAGGVMLIHGETPEKYEQPVAYVPQREEVDWRFPVTVFDVVAMGRYGRGRWLKRLSARDKELVQESLERLDITKLAGRAIGELSGGEQQRVFLARALAQEPHVLLLDEPFTGVDVGTREATLALLGALREQSVTVLVSTHDLDLAGERFDQLILLNKCLISAGPPQEVFTEKHLQAAFGGQMVVVNGRAIVVDQCCGSHGPADRCADQDGCSEGAHSEGGRIDLGRPQ